MINFSTLSEDEYLKICSAIPHTIIVGYFQKNPKEFSRIRPGFRASAITNRDAIKLLATFRNRGFISSFLEQIVKDWIKDIIGVVDGYRNNGESELTAYIHTLYQSYFADNISAFFKLIEKEYDDEHLSIIADIVSLLKEIDGKQKELETASKETVEALNISERNNRSVSRSLEKANKQIEDLTGRLEKLKTLNKQFQDLSETYEKSEKENSEQKKQLEDLRRQISQLSVSLKDLKKENSELEVSIRTQIDKEKEAELMLVRCPYPISPVDLSEFQEYFSYNLESIGVKNSPLPTIKLLSVYISTIVFQGRPIVCNRSCGNVLTKCISNALAGNVPADTIVFSAEKAITKTLLNCGRIVVLDNFLGNYNESVLLSLLERFKNKIIFLTVTYDGTLRYLSEEFFSYCNYVNLSNIPAFSAFVDPDEDPSIVEEKEYSYEDSPKTNRYVSILNSIMKELGYSKTIVNIRASKVANDTSLCGYLLFDVLPFFVDVQLKNPFNYSETLQRYVEKCPYKNVFEEWFLK